MVAVTNKKKLQLDRSGFDNLQKELKSNCQFSRTLVNIIQSRAQLEIEYSKGLSKLHTRLLKATECLSGTVSSAWKRTAATLDIESQAHLQISSRLIAFVMPPCKDFLSAFDKEIKPVCLEVNDASSRFLVAKRFEAKFKKKADAAYQLSSDAFGACDAVNQFPKRISTTTNNTQLGISQSTADSSSSNSSNDRCRFKSSTLPTEPSIKQTGLGFTNQSSLPEKMTSSVWQSVLQYYRSCLNSEDARIEWHSNIFKNTCKIHYLEKNRLASLSSSLLAYHSAVFDSLPAFQTAGIEVKTSYEQINTTDDFLLFYNMTFLEHANRIPHSSTITAPYLKDVPDSVSELNSAEIRSACNSTSDGHFPVTGSSRQALIALPGESDSLYCLTPELRKQAIQKLLEKRLLIFPPVVETTSSESLQESFIKLERASFSRQLVLSIANRFLYEAVKEERTKQGLINLVKVYSTTPSLTDQVTLTEARRRLFTSRSRLAFISANRAKLTCLYHTPDDEKTAKISSLQSKLASLNFVISPDWPKFPTKPYAASALIRWVSVLTSVEDANRELGPTCLEWPPVSSEIQAMEDLPEEDLLITDTSSTTEGLTSSLDNGVFQFIENNNNSFVDLTDSDFESDLEADHPSTEVNLVTQTLPVSSQLPLPQYLPSTACEVKKAPSTSHYNKHNSTKMHKLSALKLSHFRGHKKNVCRNSESEASTHSIKTSLCDNSNQPNFESITKPELDDNSKLELNRSLKKAGKTLYSKTFFTRIGKGIKDLCHHSQNPVEYPEILTPWRTEFCETNADTEVINGSPAPLSNANRFHASLTSLHCVGWAKALKNFTPTCDGDMKLLAGEIISISQKLDSTWWIGQVEDRRGRFPVSHIEEF